MQIEKTDTPPGMMNVASVVLTPPPGVRDIPKIVRYDDPEYSLKGSMPCVTSVWSAMDTVRNDPRIDPYIKAGWHVSVWCNFSL